MARQPGTDRMKPKKKPNHALRHTNEESSFREVVALIEEAREHALRSVNTTLIELYWQVGEYISNRIETDGWGQGTVTALAHYIRSKQLGVRGFSAPNLWRMRQFYATYRDEPKLSSLLRELTWTHNLLIQSACKRPEQREFYLRLAIRERWDTRELERQLKSALFERTVLAPPKLSAVLRELQPSAETIFKDAYLLDFLDLPTGHSEADLQAALVANLRTFLLEFGGDFTFAGERFRVQVGGRDFELDLLFFHRGLNCLVAIELKIDEFQPEYLGKLEFYLEALDRDVRKPHEQPSIGVLLCATKNNEVVEYALSRAASPALIAEYQTQLPDKKLLERKLHEFYQLALPAPEQSPSKTTRSANEKTKSSPKRQRGVPTLPLSASKSPTSRKPRKKRRTK